jgi:hypothetical protein
VGVQDTASGILDFRPRKSGFPLSLFYDEIDGVEISLALAPSGDFDKGASL